MTSSATSIIKNLLILFLVIAGLYYAKEFLMPPTVGALMATLFLPFCKWLEAKHIPKGLAVTICLLTLLMLIAGIGTMLGWQIAELTTDLTLLEEKTIETVNRFQQYIFNHFGISFEQQWQILMEQQSAVTNQLQFVAGSLAYVFANFILILVYIFCLLYYRSHIKNFLIQLSDPSQQEEMEQVVYRAANVSQQYLVGLAKMIVCLWIMYSIGFSIVGVKNAIFFAILCGLLEIVPYIGNITGTTITVLVSAVQGASMPQLTGIVIIYGAIQLIQGWILEPLIVGPQVRINPLFTIIALIVGRLVWGVPGMFIAIPAIAMFKIVCDHIESLKPYGFLVGEIESKQRETDFIKKIKSWYKKNWQK